MRFKLKPVAVGYRFAAHREEEPDHT
jgi:hypothetical protein